MPGTFNLTDPNYAGHYAPGTPYQDIISGAAQPLAWWHGAGDGTGGGQFEGNLSLANRVLGQIQGGGLSAAAWQQMAAQSAPPPVAPKPTMERLPGNTYDTPIGQQPYQNQQLTPQQAIAEYVKAAYEDRQRLGQIQQTNAWGPATANLINQQLASWETALNTMYAQAANGQMWGYDTNYFKSDPNLYTKPFVMQGSPYSGDVYGEVLPPQPTPGLQGAMNNTPMWAPYNNGNMSTQQGGQLVTQPGGYNYQPPAYGPTPTQSSGIMGFGGQNGGGYDTSVQGSVIPSGSSVSPAQLLANPQLVYEPNTPLSSIPSNWGGTAPPTNQPFPYQGQ